MGKTLAVRVTFTDDAGNDETVTSEATEVVRSSALQLESANVNGATLTLTYNEDLDGYVSVPVSAFTVTGGRRRHGGELGVGVGTGGDADSLHGGGGR